MVESPAMKIVVIGAGFTGMQLARELVSEGNEVILIDRDPEKVRHASDQLDCTVLEEDCSNLEALEDAGVASADALVTLTEDDELNMVTCSLVDAVHPGMLKIARVRNYAYYQAADAARRRVKQGRPGDRPLYGIDAMLNPDVEAASAIASSIEHGAVGNVVELGGGFGIATLSVGEGSPLDGLSLRQISALDGWRYLVAFIDSGGEISLPGGDAVVHAGDLVGVVAQKDALAGVLSFTKTPAGEFRRVVLFGADRVGSLLLARRQARRAAVSPWMQLLGLAPRTPERDITVVDMDAARCREVVERFPGVRALCGDVTDESLLGEENLFESDLLVAASGNHELNLVTAAYMKSRGVKKVVALTANSSYGAIARKLGVDVAVPMRGSVVDAIMGHLRGRHVTSVHSVCDRRFEIVEGEIPPKSRVIGHSLRELTQTDAGGALVLLHRPPEEDVWSVARGSTVLGAGSHVVMITRSGDTGTSARFFGRE